MTPPRVRRIGADEWERVKSLRLESTSDPDAAIAFLESPDEVAARPDSFWVERAQQAATGETAAQFVAVSEDAWVASLSVLIRATGQTDHLGRYIDDRRADVVGVYVHPTYRGTGAVDLLLDAAAEWVRGAGLTMLSLDVHRDNLRAQAAYRRCGFAPTGEEITGPIGPEIVMSRTL
ncbi:GNAT family N-acetyltransferase [Microbacterium sp. HD4P20]|uniref:GNAT family N-acetyltransferase n=1 Tax=Microbacterium sp. HD4P20 TaxID=2864874 RepID=UPI001C63F78B|nr:GNAT family N-acetyltransferase [Microbacterium sp. HD4P20]MCP2636923.1 GNAT family N-acetyltransferase [Microbacterium sp. HD4P20]